MINQLNCLLSLSFSTIRSDSDLFMSEMCEKASKRRLEVLRAGMYKAQWHNSINQTSE